jgi:CheY-like chemotaxis protein
MYLPRQVAPDVAGITVQTDGSKSELTLVVEDELDLRISTIGLLAELGYAVLEAADGATALRLLGRSS